MALDVHKYQRTHSNPADAATRHGIAPAVAPGAVASEPAARRIAACACRLARHGKVYLA
jgi:hypothetical protein